MQIQAEGLSKKFNNEWIFKNFNYQLFQGSSYAFTGPNGSGKTTLLHVLMGMLPPSRGKIHYLSHNQEIPEERFFAYQTLAAPYLELVEELTLNELLAFHFNFKKLYDDFDHNKVKARIGLQKSGNKQIKNFSSGMKQRLKLGLALFSDVPCLFLDEPCSNLDADGVDWYREEIANNAHRKLIIICSNQEYEYEFVKEIIKLEDYK